MTQLTSRQRSLTMKTVNAVAHEKGVSTDELAPLYETIETDALNALFAPLSEDDRNGHVRFQYEGYTVTVHSNGTVDISPVERER